jgi:hypothetical protein
LPAKLASEVLAPASSGNAKSGALSPGANFLPKFPPKLLSEFLFKFFGGSFDAFLFMGPSFRQLEWRRAISSRSPDCAARLSGEMRIVAEDQNFQLHLGLERPQAVGWTWRGKSDPVPRMAGILAAP